MFVACIGLLMGCEEPIEPSVNGFDDLLVVEGLISDQQERQSISLARTSMLNDSTRRVETGANVRVAVSDGTIHEFAEEAPGIYRSKSIFGADFTNTYQLLITTKGGKEYTSNKVPLTASSPIDSLWAEFKVEVVSEGLRGQGMFTFYLKNKNTRGQTEYYRWEWKEIYKIRLTLPSRWKWLGGADFEFRDESNYETQEEYCFRSAANPSLLLGSTENQNMQLLRHPIHSVSTKSRKIVHRYLFELTQYGLSATARDYWEDVDRLSRNQGSLFDEQPGTLVGNILSLSEPSETVLGIFEVSQKSTRKVYYIPSDFYGQGLVLIHYSWVDCQDSELITPGWGKEEAFMQRYSSTYELQDYYDCCGPRFVTKDCGLCTRYGTNIEPEEWEE